LNISQLNSVFRRMLLLPVLALALFAAILVWQIFSAVSTVRSIQIEDRNIALATGIGLNTINEETGLRGFQITHNEIFLQPYQASAGSLVREFDQLRTNLNTLHEDVAPVNVIQADNGSWKTAIAEPVIAAVKAGSDTSDTGLNLRAKGRMDAIRAELLHFIQAHRDIRNNAATRFELTVRHTVELAIGLALLTGLMLGIYARSQLHAVAIAFAETLEALRRNSAEVQASAQRLRTTLTSIGDAVVVTSIDSRVEMLNPVAERLTGWSFADAIHRPVGEVVFIVDEVSREPLDSPVDRVLRERRTISLPERSLLISRAGQEFPIADSASPILDSSGRVTGSVMVFRDITEQRQIQSALLATEKLAVAGRLAATIAHEIHNPLDSVINLLYLLRNEPTPEETRNFLQMASDELDRVAQISRAMLGMYRESKLPVALDVGALIASLLLLLERNLALAGVTVRSDLDPNAIVTGHPAELRQVFTNLLTNAIEASAPGDTLTLNVHRTPVGVTTTITDTGVGIGDEDMSRIFQPFFTTKGEAGTGLGLWVSQGILQKHGGEIHVTSSVAPHDHGTAITVRLPRGDALLRA
jgi:PAS domain S-box-containing protein